MDAVVIGMASHKRSATIEVMDAGAAVVGGGRYATDVAGYRAMLAFAKAFPAAHLGNRGVRGDREAPGTPVDRRR